MDKKLTNPLKWHGGKSYLTKWIIDLMDGSDNPAWWPNGDLFNGGVYGGYYASLAGPAKNLRLAADVSPYLFEWEPGARQFLKHFDEAQFPVNYRKLLL